MTSLRDAAVSTLLETGVVAVVRADRPDDLVDLARALSAGGVRLIEFTMTVPGALRVIEHASAELAGDVIVGAGTVLDAVTARLAVVAGAGFIVGPNFDSKVIEVAHRYSVAAIPGCLTPSEIAQAWSAGADVVKLFPGRVATPGYFADLRGPFPHVRLMPTGNVDLDTAPQYIAAGAVAVGVGKALVDPEALKARDWATITERARRFREVVDRARQVRG